jgi:hypothetical protein
MWEPSYIESMEKQGAREAYNNGRLPTPSGSEWESIRGHYQLPPPKRVDGVVSAVELPPDWKALVDEGDPSGRRAIIFDHEQKRVGEAFVKYTPYEQKGWIYFDAKRLRELGIISPKDS